MTEDSETKSQHDLNDSIRHVRVDDRDIYLVGTAHVSKQSVADVREAITTYKPDTICVELCESRFKIFQNPDEWKNMDIFEVLRKRKAVFLLAQLIMTSFYRRIGDQLGIRPGAEMAEGIRLAKETGADLALIDRDIQTTLKRTWRRLNCWNKLKLFAQILTGLFVVEKIDDEMIDAMKKQDQIEGVLETFAQAFPSVKKTLIDERDVYLAQKIRETKGKKIVAAVGAGHLPGICSSITEEKDLQPLMRIPQPSIWPKVLKWGIPAIIVAIIAYGFYLAGAKHVLGSIWIWVMVNGLLSAIGTAIALGHPLTIIAAFVAAPLTSLNPTIAAGWVAGLVQAWVKRPTVADLENLPEAIAQVKGFWKNPVCRILLVVVLANIGSSLGTFIAAGWLGIRIL